MMDVHVVNNDTTITIHEPIVTYHETIGNDDIIIFDILLCIIFIFVVTIGAIRNIVQIHKMNKATLQLMEELDRVTNGDDNDNI